MAEKNTQQKIIVILIASLLAVVAAGVVIIFVIPSAGPPQDIDQTDATPRQAPTSTFDTSVLQRSDYTLLDIGLFIRGLIPVKPPIGAGKANPFI